MRQEDFARNAVRFTLISPFLFMLVFVLGFHVGRTKEREWGWSEERRIVAEKYLFGADLRGWDPWMFQVADAVEHDLRGPDLGAESWSPWFAIDKTTHEPVLLYQVHLPEEKVIALPVGDLLDAANAYRNENGSAVSEDEFYGAAIRRAREIVAAQR